jgi:hypothetical protein
VGRYQSAIWAITHRLCRVVWKNLHGGRFIEHGSEPGPAVRKRRAQNLARALRRLGYDVPISPINPAIQNGMQNPGVILEELIFDEVHPENFFA